MLSFPPSHRGLAEFSKHLMKSLRSKHPSALTKSYCCLADRNCSTSSSIKRHPSQFILPINQQQCYMIKKRYFSDDNRKDSESEGWLSKENQTIPNYITFARIFASPGLTYAVMNDMKVWALGGCVVFAISDWLDGYIAKNYNQKSTLGAYLDPLADKVMIGSLSVGLMYQDLLPTQLVGLILGRDIFLLGMSFIIRGIDKPPDAPFFETTKSSTFEVVPSDISKINTGIQFALLSSTLSHFAFGYPSMAYIEPLWWITATTTIMSGLGYLDGSAIKFKHKK